MENNNIYSNDVHDHQQQIDEQAIATSVDPFICYINYLSDQQHQQKLSFSKMNHLHQHQLSSDEMIRIAGARFLINSSPSASYDCDDYDVSLSEEDTKKVDLIELLLAASHKVDVQDYHQAATLVRNCIDRSSSDGEDSIQRLVSYFSQALLDRISFQSSSPPPTTTSSSTIVHDPATVMISSCLPMGLASQFAGIQAIIDEVSGAKRVHIIDLFSIRSGAQWTILISALANSSHQPIQLLKLTAVGLLFDNNDHDHNMIEETGNKLVNFAKMVNVPFSFRAIMVTDLRDLSHDMVLNLHEDDDDVDENDDEVIALYLEYMPRKLIRSPTTEFDTLMKVIKGIDPSIMVVSEIEANHNSPAFAYRFMEALFFFGAYFECIEACMDVDGGKRMDVEAMYCGESIRNIVACEGEERMVRNVPLRAWRVFCERFGMDEVQMGSSCLEKARVVIENVGYGGLCTVEMDEKSLIVGWKGTPLHSVSTWKFIGT
ncbi:DELLA protein GAIP [Linum perenne]